MIAVRLRVTSEMLADHDVWISHDVRRYVLGQLWDVPAGVRCFVDLGPVKHLDPELVRELAGRPCAGMVVFESASWRVARAFADALNASALALRVAS